MHYWFDVQLDQKILDGLYCRFHHEVQNHVVWIFVNPLKKPLGIKIRVSKKIETIAQTSAQFTDIEISHVYVWWLILT